jgi:uncharacterized protein YkwD
MDILDAVNDVRSNPQAFIADLEEDLRSFDGKTMRTEEGNLRTSEGPAAVEEAIEFLRRQRPLRELEWSESLAASSEDHVRDLGSKGRVAHKGSDGSLPHKRISRYASRRTGKSVTAENIYAGPSRDAVSIVLALIVDDGVRDRGHRKAIFMPELTHLGAAIGRHNSEFGNVCVMNMSAGMDGHLDDDYDSYESYEEDYFY